MEHLPLITVIVPVYRVEKYLDQCLKSITGQTYENLEILLVDDGSPDDSGKICDRWAGQDSRVRVIHKANAGAGAARNTALDEAKGSLVGFVDSDDYLHPNFYNYLYSLMTEEVDISECVVGETDGNDLPMGDGTGANVLACGTEEALRLHIRDEMFCQTPPNKLYRAETIGDIRFPEGNYRVIGNARKLAHSDACMYAYRQTPGSAMHKPYSLRRLQGLDAKTERLAYLQNRFPGLVDEAKRDLLLTCLFSMQGCLRSLSPAEMATAREKIGKAAALTAPLEIPADLGVKRRWLLKSTRKNLEGTARFLNFLIKIHVLT